MRYSNLIPLLVLSFFTLFAKAQSKEITFTQEENDWIKKNQVVYYGYDPAWKPLEYADMGKHQGISKDYCDILSERIGIRLKPHPEADSWESALELFEQGKLHVLPCISKNDERDKTMLFTSSYLAYDFVIVVKKGSEFIGSIEDLDGKSIASPKGYAITNLIENESLDINIIYAEDIEHCLMKVEMDEADACVANLAVVSHYLNYSGYENLKISAPTDYPKIETRFAVPKDQKILHGLLEKALATITPKERNEIVQNWVSVQFEHGVDMARIWKIVIISAAIVLAIILFILYWNRKLNKEIGLRKVAESKLQVSLDEISDQKMIIEMKNDEVLDSIKYAKRLQYAILPSLETIDKHLPENFVFYKPKDIIAGDFYWFEKVENDGQETLFIAAADCTGHGVPGAMVSVVCSNALNRSVLEYGIKEPGAILDKTTDLVIDRFSKSEENVRDGMDIGLCSINYHADGSAQMQFAGANNHLWLISKREDIGVESNKTTLADSAYILHEVRATKQPVGHYDARKAFETSTIQVEKGEHFYLYSDGFADQFGGMSGKKFKNKAFKQLILSYAEVPLNEQHSKLNKAFEEWKSDYEQLDDVCVIGVCV